MKSLPLSNIPTLDFSTQDRDYLTQQRKDFEYRLQLLSNIQPSDDFNGVREQLVKEDTAIAEEDYIQAAATNVTTGKMSTTDAAGLVKAYTSEQFSADTALEKRATDNLLEELFQDDEEMYAVYSNNPEAFQRDYDYTVNSLLVNKLYDDYQISWKSDKNKARYLTEAGAEFVTSWGASWAGFGFPLEATKQGFKIEAFKDIVNVKDDMLTPTALGYNLNRVITQKAKELSPDEFNNWLTGTLKPAIDSLPMIYQTEVLESTLEGYLAGNNFFLVSDFGDWGRLGKALQKSKGSVDKTVGNFTKALDDVITREEEALSATAKPDTTDATVLKNEKKVKKDVVKNVVKEEVDAIETEDKEFAESLVEQEKIDEVSDPVNKSVIDNKSFGEENVTLIGRSDGKPFATMEEAAIEARRLITSQAEADGKKIVSAWSKVNYDAPSRSAIDSGEGTQIEGRGLYSTLQRSETILNSSKNYEIEFREFLPDKAHKRIKKGVKGFKRYLKKNFDVDFIEDDFPFDKYLSRIGEDFHNLRRDGMSVRRAIKTLKNRYLKEFTESYEHLNVLDVDASVDSKESLTSLLLTSDYVEGSVEYGTKYDNRSSYLVLDYITKGVPLNKEPVNKFFIFDNKDYRFLNEDLIDPEDSDVLLKDWGTLEQILNVFKKHEVLVDDNGVPFFKSDYGRSFGTPFKEVEDLKNAFKERDSLLGLRDKIWNIRLMEDALAAKLEFDNPGKNWQEYYKEASEILMNETNLGGAWHSNVNLMSYREDVFTPFFTEIPNIKDGKVTYSRRIDNPEFLKYYAEPVQINGKWYVKKYNGDEEFIKIEGN
jgi:hypothetical protein